jgi:hypothetical protein
MERREIASPLACLPTGPPTGPGTIEIYRVVNNLFMSPEEAALRSVTL